MGNTMRLIAIYSLACRFFRASSRISAAAAPSRVTLSSRLVSSHRFQKLQCPLQHSVSTNLNVD
jgi:hypothetical protein